ncbi:MAG: proline dehydrogenase family protein, partial [Cyanobacteria bacterium J06628_6]
MVASTAAFADAETGGLGYETQTQQIAKTLLADTRQNRSWLSQVRDQVRWDDRLLGFAMANPALRVQLFRLIDCLPALRSKADIARHLQDYLTQEAVELPGALKGLINFSQPDSMPGQLAATTLSTAVETLAKKYIAGETNAQVIKTLTQLRKQKFAFTLDLLGEAVITEAEAEAYLNRYLALMAQLAEAAKRWPIIDGVDRIDGEDLPKAQVSVKLTAFYSQFDPLDPAGSEAKVSERVRTLLREADRLGVAVHFDMEQYVYKALTLDILKRVLSEPEFRQRRDVGMTLQAYLRDSDDDLQGVIDWVKTRGTPLTVRLVKGAYWDQETIKALQHHWPQPVYNDKASTDANFERMTE